MTAASTLRASRYRVDVSSNGSSWHALAGITALDPEVTPVKVATVVFGGRPRTRVRDVAWSLSATYLQLVTGTTRDSGQGLVEGCVNQLGDDAVLFVRWYDRDGLADAWQGKASVELTRAATGVPDAALMTALFTGDGALAQIVNPLP